MRVCALLLAVFLLNGCTPEPPAESIGNLGTAPVAADSYYQQATAAFFQARPLTASAYNLSETQAGASYQSQLPLYQSSRENALRQTMHDAATALRALPLPAEPAAALNQQVMISLLQFYGGAPTFSQGYIDSWLGHAPFIINPLNSPAIELVNGLINAHQISNPADAEHYLRRLAQLATSLQSIGDKFETDARQGWLPARVVLEKSLHILGHFSQPDAVTHPLWQDLHNKLTQRSNISTADQQQLLDKAKLLLKQQVIPAYQQLSQRVRAQLPHATTDTGLWALPGGAEFYAYSVRQLGDTELNPAQIHQLGLAEVNRLSKQMDQILRSQGYLEGTVGDRIAALAAEPRFLYDDSTAGREQLLQDINGYIAQITPLLTQQFSRRPPYQVIVKRTPIALQDSAPAGQYNAPALDASQPAVYWINLADIRSVPRFALKTLSFHETIPGHHWQISLHLDQSDRPLLQRVAAFNAFSEGWALYAEQLAAELGLYQDDPFGELGRLKAELLRAVRLVVDTGLHQLGWTRQQAIDLMLAETGEDRGMVESEIDRYLSWPAQALGYMVGQLKILELRDRARAALGARFDIRRFHNTVLDQGALPLTVLERQVDAWIAAEKLAGPAAPATR